MVVLLALIVSEVQETQPTFGLVHYEEGKPTTERFVDSLKASKTILTEMQDLHRGRNTPMLVLNDHCQVCEFRARCHKQAVKEDNLSLLRGMNDRQITHLRGRGIFTVNQLTYTFRARRRPKRAKKAAPIHHLPPRALALREKKIFVHGDPQVSLADFRIYLDIEGTPENQTYYLTGIYVVSSECETQETYWTDADSEQDEVRIFVSLLDTLSRYSDYSPLHFGNYKVVALRRMRTRMGEPYASQIDDVLKHSFNVLSLITAHVYFPTYSNSLKDIGSFLGYRWSDPSSTGMQTLVWRSRWLGKRDTSSRAKLIQYNKEDCTALRGVVDLLENVLPASRSVPAGNPGGSEVVRTSELSAKRSGWSLFGETQYVLDEFRAINKLSYFDLGGCEFYGFRNPLYYMRQLDFPARIAQASHQPTSDERYDRKPSYDADSRSTLRAGVHRIYLPAPVDAQAWTEVQTRLSLRLQPYPVGTLHRHAMEVLAGAQDSRWEG
jgi:predicted RecB family nuclease